MVTIAGAEDRQRPPVRRQGGDQQVRHDGGEWRRPTGVFKIEDGDANNGSIVLEESNFEVLKPSILGDNQSVNDFTVSFHLSENDAQTNSPIIFPFKTPEKDPFRALDVLDMDSLYPSNGRAAGSGPWHERLCGQTRPIRSATPRRSHHRDTS